MMSLDPGHDPGSDASSLLPMIVGNFTLKLSLLLQCVFMMVRIGGVGVSNTGNLDYLAGNYRAASMIFGDFLFKPRSSLARDLRIK